MRCHWIFTLGFGLFWLLLQQRQMEYSYEGDPTAMVRFVERDLLLLDAGEYAGPIVQYWTGFNEREETLEEFQRILSMASDSPIVWELQDEIDDRLANPEKVFSTQEERKTQLNRSLVGGGVYWIAMVMFPVVLWRGRRGFFDGGPRWRIPGEWSVSLVLMTFFFAGMVAEYFVFTGFSSYVLPFLPDDWWEISIALVWRGSGPLIAAIFLMGTWRAMGRVYGLGRPVRWQAVFGAFSVLAAFEWLRQTVGATSEVVDPSDFLLNVDPSGWEMAVDLIEGAIFAPVFEELMFRGVLFMGLMRRLGGVPAALVSTILFALVHTQYEPWEMVSVGVFGLACCWLVWRTGSLKSGIALHMLYNALITFEVYLLYQARI